MTTNARTRTEVDTESDEQDVAEQLAPDSKPAVVRTTEPLAFLLATHCDRISVPDALGPRGDDSPQRLKGAVKKPFHKYYKVIKDSHGIKEYNVLELFAPLGIPASVLGSTLLPDLNTAQR